MHISKVMITVPSDSLCEQLLSLTAVCLNCLSLVSSFYLFTSTNTALPHMAFFLNNKHSRVSVLTLYLILFSISRACLYNVMNLWHFISKWQ